jgi:predicted nucleic acid-binding protein
MPKPLADTSFLFSLFGNDVHSLRARRWARQVRDPIAITLLSQYEFGNAIRFASFRKLVSRPDALASLSAFQADLRTGFLQLTSCDLVAVAEEAERLSDRHTWTGGHRSFDVLHVATAKILKAPTFLTFDSTQKKLAIAEGLIVRP